MSLQEEELIEKLAKLEHDQWMLWTYHTIVNLERAMDTNAKLPIGSGFLECEIKTMIRKWDKNRRLYSELPEEIKELDRIWARKVLEAVNSEVF